MKKTKPQTTCPEGQIQNEMYKICQKFGIQLTKEFYIKFYKEFQTYIYFSHNTKQAANDIIDKINNYIKSN